MTGARVYIAKGIAGGGIVNCKWYLCCGLRREGGIANLKIGGGEGGINCIQYEILGRNMSACEIEKCCREIGSRSACMDRWGSLIVFFKNLSHMSST